MSGSVLNLQASTGADRDPSRALSDARSPHRAMLVLLSVLFCIGWALFVLGFTGLAAMWIWNRV